MKSMTTMMSIAAACALAAGCAAPTDSAEPESTEGTSSAVNIFGQTPTISVSNVHSTSAHVEGTGFSPNSTAQIWVRYAGASGWITQNVTTTATYIPPCKPGTRCGVAFTGGTFSADVNNCIKGAGGTAYFYGYDPTTSTWTLPWFVQMSGCVT